MPTAANKFIEFEENFSKCTTGIITVKIYKCFIASPDDTKKEREISDKVFQEINKSIGEKFHFRIEALKWENDTRPSFSSDSQTVINEQIGSAYEIFIGIMFKKFGTPTKSAGSGTEEEFNNAYDRLKKGENIEIMFYFNDEAPSSLSEVNPTELEKVNSFKKKVSELGCLYCCYHGASNFESHLRNHLNQFFLKNQDKNSLTNVNALETNVSNQSKDVITAILTKRLDDALCAFSTQPLIWVDPILSSTNEISQNPDDNYNNRVVLTDFISNPKSTIIKSPPLFGLTCLAHYLVKEAWGSNSAWI